MIAIAQALSSELQSVHDTSVVIKAVSNQARYLALQVSILVNQAGESQLSGVSRVASDISLLSGQTFAAGQRMDTMAGQLQNRIQELSQLAQQEAAVAQSLMHRLERTRRRSPNSMSCSGAMSRPNQISLGTSVTTARS
jgi:hypothetical protein